MLLTSVLKSLMRRSPPPRREAASDEAAIAQALAARECGDVNRALAVARGILSRQPADGRAQYLVGLWLAQEGRIEEGLPHLRRAAELLPGDADVRLALGNVHKALGQAQAAEACYRKTIELAPHSGAGHYNLGLVLRALGHLDGAARHLAQSCEREPFIPEAWSERVAVLVAAGRHAEAVDAARAAVDRDPQRGAFWSILAFAHQKAHAPLDALACFDRAAALGVDDHEFHNNRAIVYQELGRMDEAVAAYELALAAKPDYELARFHLALLRLSLRQYERAWDDYELRLLSEESRVRIAPHRAWRGEPLEGRSVLVHGEQGLGDEIMFASCIGEVAAAARRCVVTCAPRLQRLFARSFPAAEVLAVEPGRTVEVAGVEVEVAAGSLPRYLRRSAAAFPRHSGYLRADPARVAYWRSRLDALGPGLKVGISWRGGTHKSRAPLRSLRLDRWAPILRTPGAQFVSLQYGDVRDDLAAAPIDIPHWAEAIGDYDETAALVGALDLVVSVCTAVIHLTGALGRPLWIMAPVSPEWRYAAAGETMDWYPTSRLFRQSDMGDWDPVIGRVAAELRRAPGIAGGASAP